MDKRDEPDDQASWSANPLADYPVGPDDTGNAVMHGVGFFVRGWRRLRSTITGRT